MKATLSRVGFNELLDGAFGAFESLTGAANTKDHIRKEHEPEYDCKHVHDT
jgi:hypothetical protein